MPMSVGRTVLVLSVVLSVRYVVTMVLSVVVVVDSD